MTPVEIAEFIERGGLPMAVAALVLWVLVLLISTGFNDHKSTMKMYEETHAELIKARGKITELTDAQLALEKKFTKAVEKLARLEGREEFNTLNYDVLEAKNQEAVEEFLDKTLDFDRELEIQLGIIEGLKRDKLELSNKLAEEQALTVTLRAQIANPPQS